MRTEPPSPTHPTEIILKKFIAAGFLLATVTGTAQAMAGAS
jgi:hypothetical protein